MPYSRATLSTIKSQILSDIQSKLPGTDPLLRFSNLQITGVALANLINALYGYLDWISKQSVPFTATDEFMYAWGALKKVLPKTATKATNGTIYFPGSSGSTIPTGTVLVRGDGATFTASGYGTVINGYASVPATADEPGSAGNTAEGVTFTFDVAIEGIQSSGAVSVPFTNGTDAETSDSFRTRMLSVYQNPPQGGASIDYINWALSYPAVTRAWVNPNGMGVGSVVVFVMMDIINSAYGGFPQGTDGTSSSEDRGTVADGDQLLVADFLYPLRPVTTLVYVASPIPQVVDFSITGLAGATQYVKDSIVSAIEGSINDHGTAAGGSVDLKHIEVAVASVSGSDGFVVVSPTGNVVTSVGYLPVLGVVSFI